MDASDIFAIVAGTAIGSLLDPLHLAVGVIAGLLARTPRQALVAWALSTAALLALFGALSATQSRDPHPLMFVGGALGNAALVFGVFGLRCLIARQPGGASHPK